MLKCLFCFHPTLVLAQPHGDSRTLQEIRPVSIPHWFSLNLVRLSLLMIRMLCFHPTLVLAQHIYVVESPSWSTGFHPTLVLAQHNTWKRLEELTPMFPSHIGSRSTYFARAARLPQAGFHPTLVLAQQADQRSVDKSYGRVSIPHWFSLNGTNSYIGLYPV